MSLYLNINQNVHGKPTRTTRASSWSCSASARRRPDGTDNYTQDDVAGLAKAFTGWRLTPRPRDDAPSPDYGKITFAPAGSSMPAKTFLGADDPGGHRTTSTANARVGPGERSTRRSTTCSRTRNHAQFLIRKLWAEFIASPIPQATLDSLVSALQEQRLPARPRDPRDPDRTR